MGAPGRAAGFSQRHEGVISELKGFQRPESVGAMPENVRQSGPKYLRRMFKIIQTGIAT
jgi:hypothetical protein